MFSYNSSRTDDRVLEFAANDTTLVKSPKKGTAINVFKDVHEPAVFHTKSITSTNSPSNIEGRSLICAHMKSKATSKEPKNHELPMGKRDQTHDFTDPLTKAFHSKSVDLREMFVKGSGGLTDNAMRKTNDISLVLEMPNKKWLIMLAKLTSLYFM